MIRSMTGFGRAEVQNEKFRFTVEIKAVNHRYLDFNFRIPKKLGMFENKLRSLLKTYIKRGKVDIFITYESFVQNDASLKYNGVLARQYLAYVKEISETLDLPDDLNAASLSRFPEVLIMEEKSIDEDALWASLEPLVRQAAEAFFSSREREGIQLKQDLTEKLDHLLCLVCEVEARAPQIISDYREKLTKKVEELLEDRQLEESRILAEVVIFADKICTDEETVRLKTHIVHMKEVLESEDGIGRKLDFIAQEMNREANTILSKANDICTSNIAIELKTEIEKVREQIQNVE